MYWLAEQGLAQKRVLLVIVPLIMIFLMEHLKNVLERKKGKIMEMIKRTFDVLMVCLNCFIDLGSNIAGGALLANAF